MLLMRSRSSAGIPLRRAFSYRDRTWMKWMPVPSISVVNCGSAFSLAWHARQS